MKQSGGFTLIELLVVIAIISILAAIMFPIITIAKETARRSTCASNHHQIWTAVMRYADDYNNRLPPAMANIKDPGGKPLWANACCTYFRGSNNNPLMWKIARCPSADRKDILGIWKPGSGYCWWWNWGLLITPGYNHVYLSPYDKDGYPMPRSVTSAARPAQTVMFADSGDASFGYFVIEAPTGRRSDSKWNYGGWQAIPGGIIAERHNRSTNVVWMDGHITTMRISQLEDDTLWDLD
ncbi:MAG TPA: prepilin-type N-terminal cleavage/methylation domain-containing protein [Armatimonadota bacterium]|nr:prepilin-type N-terminal cleavage/methylation domain-containing protein [Armatimonadota bacterium]HPP76182.1 prepilin-type N-terminal cleavage/methylation domain-containing protein [Armatimonadota bacterium]